MSRKQKSAELEELKRRAVTLESMIEKRLMEGEDMSEALARLRLLNTEVTHRELTLLREEIAEGTQGVIEATTTLAQKWARKAKSVWNAVTQRKHG